MGKRREESGLADRRATALTAATALMAVLAACGGGSELLLVAGFIGSGGGLYYQDDVAVADFQPVDCGGQPCVLSLTVDLPPDPNTGVPPPVLYGSGYPVRGSGGLPGCANASGRVEGRRVLLGTCFTGAYVNPNQIRSDDGKTVLFHDFFPSLTEGVWVDVNNADLRYKFSSSVKGCEITSAGQKVLAVEVTPSNYSNQAFDVPPPPLQALTVIKSLKVTGGDSWTGEFIGASSMRLTTAGRTIEIERRNQAAACN